MKALVLVGALVVAGLIGGGLWAVYNFVIAKQPRRTRK